MQSAGRAPSEPSDVHWQSLFHNFVPVSAINSFLVDIGAASDLESSRNAEVWSVIVVSGKRKVL